MPFLNDDEPRAGAKNSDSWKRAVGLITALLLVGCQTITQEPRRTKICIKNNSGKDLDLTTNISVWSLRSPISQTSQDTNPLSEAFNRTKLSAGSEICREQELFFEKRVPSFDLTIEGIRSTLHYYSGFGDLYGWGSDCDWSKAFCLRGSKKAKFYDGTVEIGENCSGSECFRFNIEKVGK
jgi:hypothetical protein